MRKKKAKIEKRDKPSTRQDQIGKLLDQMEEKFGPGKVISASKADCSYLLRRPCGIFSLDLATAGGLATGSLAEIVGPESIGKNYLANRYIARCQDIYKDAAKVFVATTEYRYDKFFAKRTGVRIALSHNELEELETTAKRKFSDEEKKVYRYQIGEITLIQGLSAEQTLEAVLDLVNIDEYQIGIVDSIGALKPSTEASKPVGDLGRLAARAALQTDFVDKFYYTIGKNTLVILINQVRADIGKWTPPGMIAGESYKISEAHAIKHGLTARILLTPIGLLRGGKDKKVLMGTGGPAGKRIKWEILKGKKGFHEGAMGEWAYYFNAWEGKSPGVDILEDFATTVLEFATRRGPYYAFMDQSFQGKEALLHYFQTNPNKIEEAKDYIFGQREIKYRYV